MLKIFFKKFGYIIALFVIAVVAAINMNVSTNKYGLSDRQLTNVEALAQGQVIIEELCLMGPNSFCEYPPCCGSSEWDIIFPGEKIPWL